MIPHRIKVSEHSSARLKFLKSKTGLTPNILSRFAFMLSIRDLRRVSRGSIDTNGMEFLAPTLFGEHQHLYELMLAEYVKSTGDERDPAAIIANLIENGLHKMGHVRSLEDVVDLSRTQEVRTSNKTRQTSSVPEVLGYGNGSAEMPSMPAK